MVLHRDERVPLSPRTVHRQTCAGICRPGAAHRGCYDKTGEQRPPRQAACAARGERKGVRTLSGVMGEAPIEVLIFRAAEFRNDESPRRR